MCRAIQLSRTHDRSFSSLNRHGNRRSQRPELEYRSAFRRRALVGHALRENQQLVVQVVNLDLATARPAHGTAEGKLPEWCNVYAGLTDEEIAGLEKTILTRADVSGRAGGDQSDA